MWPFSIIIILYYIISYPLLIKGYITSAYMHIEWLYSGSPLQWNLLKHCPLSKGLLYTVPITEGPLSKVPPYVLFLAT